LRKDESWFKNYRCWIKKYRRWIKNYRRWIGKCAAWIKKIDARSTSLQRPINSLQASLAALGAAIENTPPSPSRVEALVASIKRWSPTIDGSIDAIQRSTRAVQRPGARAGEAKRHLPFSVTDGRQALPASQIFRRLGFANACPQAAPWPLAWSAQPARAPPLAQWPRATRQPAYIRLG
jgi:hypothetical protein